MKEILERHRRAAGHATMKQPLYDRIDCLDIRNFVERFIDRVSEPTFVAVREQI